ncbi:zinc transporter ZupT [Candidatus Micrarchaeota archaeon]|nr:zinc transporter ZupT [Candidatus Micrarchaeota archaeon]
METTVIWLALALTIFAGLSTGIGSLIALFIKKFKDSHLCIALGFSAGVMIYISFSELLPSAVADIGFLFGNLAFFAGILFIALIDFLIPHEYIAEHMKVDKKNRKLMKAGVFIALGIAIHNFPEGLVTFMATLKDVNLGIPLAIAIAIHNIPEGIAISMPIFYATKSRKKAFMWSFLSGVAEPVGAVIGFLLLSPFLTPMLLSAILAFVAGIMVFISFDELLPLTFKGENSHLSIVGIIMGMFVMALSLYLL